MTLLEMKKKVLRLIEEINDKSALLTDDPDIANKINDVINQVQNEISRIKKIPGKMEKEVEKDEEINIENLDENIYQLNVIRGVSNIIIGNTIIFNEKGTAKIYYYKYPKQITYDTKDSEFTFDLSTDVLEIMPYGVAGDLLKSDISASYGQVYSNRYEQMLQRLDPRYHTGSIYLEGDDTYEFL